MAAITTVKNDRFLSFVIRELVFPQDCPIPIDKDNDPTIDIVNSMITTEITRRIDVQLFTI